jgi:hypothetical protein
MASTKSSTTFTRSGMPASPAAIRRKLPRA